MMYTAAYHAVSSNVSTDALSNAWHALPRDTDLETLLGIQCTSDSMSTSAPNVTRTLVYQPLLGALIPDPQMGDMLQNMYTATWSEALSTPVTADKVTHS